MTKVGKGTATIGIFVKWLYQIIFELRFKSYPKNLEYINTLIAMGVFYTWVKQKVLKKG